MVPSADGTPQPRTITHDDTPSRYNIRQFAASGVMASESGVTFQETFEYTPGGRVKNKKLGYKRSAGGTAAEVALGYGYNNEGRMTSMTYPGAGPVLTYGLDEQGRPVTLSASGEAYQWVNSVNYDAGQRVVSLAAYQSLQGGFPDYKNFEWQYNNVGQLKRVKAGATVDLEYTYPAPNDGRVLQVKDWMSCPANVGFR